LKNAAAGLAHSGAKSVIAGNPTMAHQNKERFVRTFAAAIRNLAKYMPGPDMGTNATAMAWIKNEIGRSVGLPREIGGIPLDETGATGFGLAVAAEVAQDFSGTTTWRQPIGKIEDTPQGKPRGALDSFSDSCLQPDARHPPTWGGGRSLECRTSPRTGDARLTHR
jgi:hypothetical protein